MKPLLDRIDFRMDVTCGHPVFEPRTSLSNPGGDNDLRPSNARPPPALLFLSVVTVTLKPWTLS
jgi:hypothetical protein